MTENKKILILHGPNLNLLGTREPEVYGNQTLDEVNKLISTAAFELRLEIECRQSNHEGILIDWLHEAVFAFSGVVFNPGAYTHYSYALRDAIAAIPIDVVEVHLSNIHEREGWRKTSVLEEVCAKQISGGGVQSYLDGLAFFSPKES